MFKKPFLLVLLMAVASHAAVKELIPNLTAADLDVQTQARLDLLAACSKASAPDAEPGARETICLEMCQVLAGDHPVVSVIQPVLNNLERIGGEEAVPTLVELLNHKDEHIRDDARRALAVNPSPRAGHALGAQLKMRKARSAKETAGLIVALGERGEEGASNLIAGYLEANDDAVFMAAVKALGRLNEDAGVKALATARVGAAGFRLTQIDAALLSMSRENITSQLLASSTDPEVQAAALLSLLLAGETQLANDALASGVPARQLAVIEAALQGKDPVVLDAVAAKVGSLPPHIQPQALGALAFSENRAYAKGVEPLLKSPDPLVQDGASRALARIGTAGSVASLLANGRPAALRALGRLDADGVDEALENVAAGSADDRRAIAIEALANRGRVDLISTFFKYAAGDGDAAPKAAVAAVGAIGDSSNLEELVALMITKESSALSRDILNAVVEITRRSSDPAKAVDILVARMEGASPRGQANILQALVQTGSQEALQPLVEACGSSDEKLQKLAVKLLGGWGADNGLPAMIELASNEEMSLANHVTLMRGCSRLLAAQKPKKLNKKLATQALEACRRDEERAAIQATIDKAKK